MTIRPAMPADARAIAAIRVRAWRTAYRDIVPAALLEELSIDDDEAVWRGRLVKGESQVWIAEDASTAVGWISAAKSRDADAAPSTGEIWALYVDPDHWRRGVGRALWTHAGAWFARAGFQDVTLWVLDANTAARAFYEALGFARDPGGRRTVSRHGAALPHARLRRHAGTVSIGNPAIVNHRIDLQSSNQTKIDKSSI
jgi:ribosomal protein S18 acetylase RimI-like enzyme